MNAYYEQAVACVRGYVLPAQRALYEQYQGDFDRIYTEGMDSDTYMGRVLEPGHVYELGYRRCTCPKVLSGEVTDPAHCECTRQSILYILNQLEPETDFQAEILGTILRGSEDCRFRITVNRKQS